MSGDNDSAKNVTSDDLSVAPKDADAQVNQPQCMRRDWGTIAVRAGIILLCICVVAPLVPLVNEARENGRRMVCQNNIRSLGLAISSYETAHRSYPGYRDSLTINNPLKVAGFTTNKVPVNWPVILWNNLFRERPYYRGVFHAFRNMEGVDVSGDGPIQYRFPKLDTDYGGLELFTCPSHPQSLNSQGYERPMSYVVNSGLQDVPATTTTPADWPDNGVFVSRWEIPQPPGQPQLMTAANNADLVSRGDGVTATVMLSENIEAGSISDVFLHVGQPGDWGSLARPVSEQRTCFVWFPEDPLPDVRKQMAINGVPIGPSPDKPGKNPSPGLAADITYARPSSHHPGGANFVFCDAHVKFITEDIDYIVFAMFMTSNQIKARFPGTETPVPKNFILTALDY
jgi:prepilin-type processing-associated H-X9-DG protein